MLEHRTGVGSALQELEGDSRPLRRAVLRRLKTCDHVCHRDVSRLCLFVTPVEEDFFGHDGKWMFAAPDIAQQADAGVYPFRVRLT